MPYDSSKHHRRSIRVKGYDYSGGGAYFVTICTENRESIFGEIIAGEMRPNDCGRIATECLNEIPVHFPNVELDGFVVMPNHVHIIVVIVDERDDGDAARRGTACRAPTSSEQFGKPVSGSLATIVRSYKSAVTKRVNEIRDTRGAPIWQRNFHEHIIRNEKELTRIRTYIESNPVCWADDENNPSHVVV